MFTKLNGPECPFFPHRRLSLYTPLAPIHRQTEGPNGATASAVASPEVARFWSLELAPEGVKLLRPNDSTKRPST